MNQKEILKWSRLTEEEWGSQIFESLTLGLSCGALWLFSIFILLACLLPPLRRRVHYISGVYLPWNICVGVFLLQGIAGIMGYPALFSVGVLAYWINSAVPAWILVPTAEFLDHMTLIGWLTWTW